MFKLVTVFPNSSDFSSDVSYLDLEKISKLKNDAFQTIAYPIPSTDWEIYRVLVEGGEWITFGEDDIEILDDAKPYEVEAILAENLDVPLVGLEPTLKRF